MLFQFVLTKFSKSELSSCLQKVDHLQEAIRVSGLFFVLYFFFQLKKNSHTFAILSITSKS